MRLQGSRKKVAEGLWTRAAGVAAIIGLPLAVFMPNGVGCQGPTTSPVALPPTNGMPSGAVPTTSPTTGAAPSVNSSAVTSLPAPSQLPRDLPKLPSTLIPTATPLPSLRQAGLQPSYSSRPVRFVAPSWCQYSILDIETPYSRDNLEPTEGHAPGVDVIYNGCGDGAELTLQRTSGKALGFSSDSATSKDHCRQDAQAGATGPIRTFPAGTVLCAITDEGGVGRIKVVGTTEPYAEDGVPTLQLEITYWRP